MCKCATPHISRPIGGSDERLHPPPSENSRSAHMQVLSHHLNVADINLLWKSICLLWGFNFLSSLYFLQMYYIYTVSYLISDNIDTDHWIVYFYTAHAIIPKTCFFFTWPVDMLIRIKELSQIYCKGIHYLITGMSNFIICMHANYSYINCLINKLLYLLHFMRITQSFTLSRIVTTVLLVNHLYYIVGHICLCMDLIRIY